MGDPSNALHLAEPLGNGCILSSLRLGKLHGSCFVPSNTGVMDLPSGPSFGRSHDSHQWFSRAPGGNFCHCVSSGSCDRPGGSLLSGSPGPGIKGNRPFWGEPHNICTRPDRLSSATLASSDILRTVAESGSREPRTAPSSSQHGSETSQ